MSLTARCVVEPTSEMIWREVAAEVVLLDPDGNVIMGLNGTGGRTWLLLDGQRDLGAVAREIAVGFQREVDVVEVDVLAFAEVLLSRGYVQRVTS